MKWVTSGMSAECQRFSQGRSSGTGAKLVEARTARAIEQLRAEGWAAGPLEGRDEWRSAVRSAARAAGLRVRTGEALVVTSTGDGHSRPWAVSRQHYEVMRALAGGVSWESVGAYMVSAEAERSRGR